MTAVQAAQEAVAATVLDYAVTPDKVIAGSEQVLTLTATNPAGGSRVTFTPGPQGDEIVLTIPAPPAETGAKALTDKVSFTAKCETDGFIAGAQPGDANAFVIKPLGQTTLQPGDSIRVTLSPVEINADPGTVSLGVEEYIGAGDGKTTIGVTKEKQGLQITAWLSQQVAGKDEAVTLYWQSAGGTVVDIAGLDEGDGTVSFPVEGKQPPYPGQLSFMPIAPGSMVLTLTVGTGDGLHEASTEVALSVRPPHLPRLEATPASGSEIRVDAEVALDWNVQYSRAVILTTPSGAGPQLVPALPLRQMKRTPGYDVQTGAPSVRDIPGTAEYLLTATGYAPQAQRAVRFKLKPVKFYYFKYMNRDAQGNLSNLSQAWDPMSWGAYTLAPGDVSTFTLYQPGGGVETYYLGASDTMHPQILYFAPAAAPSGGKVTLEWQTANLTKLVLDPGGTEIAADDIAKGSMEVPVPADNLVMLTGTAANGETVPSILPLSAATS